MARKTTALNRWRTGAANFSASGLKRQDNDLIVIDSVDAAFKRNFDAQFAKGETLPAQGYMPAFQGGRK
jgi:hypothetical protein